MISVNKTQEETNKNHTEPDTAAEIKITTMVEEKIDLDLDEQRKERKRKYFREYRKARRQKEIAEMLLANKTQEENNKIPPEPDLASEVKMTINLDLIKEQRKANKRKYFREYRKAQRLQETPEQKRERRAKNNELYKRRCLKKKIEAMSRVEQEPDKHVGKNQQNEIQCKSRIKNEFNEAHCNKMNYKDLQTIRERHRKNRKLRQLRMTPEQKEARRIKIKEQNRLKQERLNREMPEKAAAIRARISEMRKRRRELEQDSQKKRKSEYMRDYRKRIRMMETPEEKEARLIKERETLRIRRQNRRLLKQQNQLDSKTQYNNIISIHAVREQHRGEMLAGSIASVPRAQNKTSSQQKSLFTCDIKIEKEVIQDTRLARINEDSQHYPALSSDSAKNSSIMQTSLNKSTGVESAFEYMRAVINLKAQQDKYWVYGEHLANQIRNSGKSDKEVYIAKQLIDNIIENLHLDDVTSLENSNISTTKNVQYVDFKSEPYMD